MTIEYKIVVNDVIKYQQPIQYTHIVGFRLFKLESTRIIALSVKYLVLFYFFKQIMFYRPPYLNTE